MKKSIVLLPLLVLIQVLRETLAGVVQPEVPDSVLPYRNNENAIGKYTFTFKMSSSVPSSPRITIDFPSIYPKLLNNVDACSGTVEVKLKNEKATFQCQIVGLQVIFDISSKWSDLDAGNIVVELLDVVNPPSVQGQSTGFFQIRTWSGIDIVIDSNVAFDSIAFAPAYTIFTSATMVNDGANIAGYTTNYILTVQTSFNYPKGTWFRMKFPSTFDYKLPLECYITNIPVGVSNLPCYVENGVIVMKDLLTDLVAGQYKFKLRNIINPKIATLDAGYFKFESLKEGVYTVIEYKEDISGVAIKSGTITDVTVIGFPLVQNLFVDYEIRYRPANEVPIGGMFNIQFPPDFNQSIDKTCRIESGLKALDSNGITCVTDGVRDLWISNFDFFTPQYVVVKCFAYNPPKAGETQNFQVRTFTDTLKTTIIDENIKAGTVVISAIDKPNFMAVDFYVKHVNCSFYADCPMNFRYFTDPTRTLPKATSFTNFSTIAIQMPIWWLPMQNGPSGAVPECLFGDIPTESCRHLYHVVSIVTPLTQDYSACELPFSIDNIRLTPIPGKFPFRIHTFYNGSKFHNYDSYINSTNSYLTPIEQDTYVMDIPPTGIAVLQTWCSGYESEDPDNLLHLRSNVHPFLFAWSGAVSVEITHEEVSLEDKAEWLKYAGVTGITDNSWKELPCKLYQSGVPTGYMAGWWNSLGLRCMMKTGDYSLKEPTLIQVTGFDSNIDKGNYYEMYIPDIKFCRTLNRQCKIKYTYTMTEDYKYPYRISEREQSLAKVLPAEIPANVQAATGATWGAVNRNNRICENTNLDLTVRIPQDMVATDYIVIKRNIDHWYHPFIELNNNFHTIRIVLGGFSLQGNAYHVMNYEKNQQYFIYRLTQTVPASTTSYTIQIQGLITSPFPNNQAWIDIVLWSNHKKMVKGRMNPSGQTNPYQGIVVDQIGFQDIYGGLPRYHQNFWAPWRFRLRICQGIPQGGEILIKYRSGASPTNAATTFRIDPTVCRVWNGFSRTVANETLISCNYDKPNERWVVKDFDTVLKRTFVRINWWIEHGLTSPSQNDMIFESYNISGNAATLTDYNSDATPPDYVSQTTYTTNVKAVYWEYQGHYEYKWELYQGGRGKFVFEIETGDNLEWEPTESQLFRFTTHYSVVHNADTLECRYAEKITANTFGHHYPSVACTAVTTALTTTVITMRLHPNLKIVSNKRYQIFLDTRNVDLNDGISFTLYGIYSINVESFIGGTKLKGGKQRFEVYGPRIPHYFVWSSNKIKAEQAFLTYYCDYFNNNGIASSDPTLATFTNIVLYFSTQGAGGYPYDLGMGYPDQSIIPCNLLLGQGYWPGVNTAICTLYYGYSGAPAKIKVEGYRNFNARIFRVDVPMVQNPIIRGVVPRTWLKVLQTNVVAGVKAITVLWEGRYYELNTTWDRNTTKYAYSTNTYGNLVSFTSTVQNAPGTVTIGFRTPQTLHANDFVLIRFPKWWPTPYLIDPTTCRGFTLLQERCYVIRNDAQDTHYLYFQINGNLATSTNLRFDVLGARSMVPPNATATHPLNYFITYIYYDTRLLATNTLNALNPALFAADPITATVNCLPTSPQQNLDTEYIVAFNMPHDLLDKSEIRIDFEDYDYGADPNCTSTTNSQLTGKVSCGLLTIPNVFASVVGFDAILRTSKVEIKLPLKNRLATGANRKWRVRTYYLREGYYYVSGDTGLFDHTAGCRVVAVPAVTNVPWPTWFHKFLRTRYNQYGPIVFIYESAYTLTASTLGDYVKIKIPIAFQFAKAEKAGSWDFHYPFLWDFQTTATDHEIKLWAPKTLDIAANTRYQINITTLNALLDVNGLLYPDQLTTPYLASIEVYKGGALVEQGDAKIFVFKPNFPKFMAKAYLMNSNQKASFRMTFSVPTTYTYNNQIVLRFRLPTATYKHRQRINLFSDDGGTGLASGSTINCHLYPDATLVPLSTTCTFTKGSQDLGIPALVEMRITTSSSITANVVYSAIFDGFTHPTVGADDKNVEPALEFYTPAGTWSYTGVDYDYTIVEDNTPVVTNSYAAPTFDSLTIGQTGISMFINFVSPVNLYKYQAANGIGWSDYLIIQFPVGYVVKYYTTTKAKLTAGTGFAASVDTPVEFSCGNNWIVWRVNINTIVAGATYTLKITGVDQASSLPPNPSFKMLIVQDRELKAIINYLPVPGLVASAILPAEMSIIADQITAPVTIPLKKYQRYLISFGHAISAVPAGAAIQIVLPASLTGIDDHCYNTAASQLKNPAGSDITVFCRWDTLTSSYIITNIAASPTSETFKIAFYAISENLAGGAAKNVIIKIFKDTTRTFQLMEGTVAVPVNSAVNGFKHLSFTKSQDQKPDVARAGESAPFNFELTLPSTYSTTTVITATFGAGVSLPASAYLECFFGEIESSECIATSTSPLTIQIRAPHSPALTPGSTYELTIRTRCGSAGQSGLVFASAGQQSVTVTDGTSTTQIGFEIFAPNFDYIQPRVMHSNNLVNNGIAFKFRNTIAIAATGSIRVRFPKTSPSGRHQLWGALGTAGSNIPNKCVPTQGFTATSGSVRCVYYEQDNYAVFQMSGFSAVASGTDLEFVLYDILNSDTTSDYLTVDAVVESVDAAGTPLNQGVAFDLFSIMRLTTSTSAAGTFSRTGNVLGQTGVSYSFSGFTITPAIGVNDQVVIEFSNSYFFGTNPGNCGTGTSGSYRAYGKYVVFKPSAAISGSAMTFCFNGISNPFGSDTSQIKLMVVYSRGFTRIVPFTPAAFTAATATVTMTPGSLNLNAGSKYSFSIDTASTIPAGGSIVVKFPTNYVVQAVVPKTGFGSDSTTTIDSTNIIAVLTTPTVYTKTSNGVVTFDIYLKNPSTTGSKTVTIEFYSQYTTGSIVNRIYTGTRTATIAGTAATTCFLGSTSPQSVATSGSASPIISPSATTTAYTAPSTAGYDMIEFASGTSGCNGLPFYVRPATSLTAGNIDILHVTVHQANLMNAVTVTGNVPAGVTFKTTGKLAVDFGNHDVKDLGLGLANGSYVPCHLEVAGVIQEAECTLNVGSFFKSPGVDMTIFANIAAGTAIKIVIAPFFNPTVAMDMEVRFRYYETVYGDRALDLVSFSNTFTILTPATALLTVSTTAVTTPSSTPTAQTAITATVVVADTGMDGGFFYRTKMSNQQTYITATSANNAVATGYYFRSTMLVSEILTDIEVGTAGYGAVTPYVVSVNPATKEAVAVRQITTGYTINACTLTAVSVTALTKNDVSGYSKYLVQFTTPCDLTRGSTIKIKLANYLSAISVSSIKLLSGTVSGAFSASSSGTTVDISGYNYVDAGQALSFEIGVTATYTAATTASDITVTLRNLGTIATATSSCALVTSSSSLAAQKYVTFVRYNKPVIINDVGYLSLHFQTEQAILSTDYLTLTQPSAAFATPTYYLRCKFTDPSARDESFLSKFCYFDSTNKWFYVQMPQTQTLSNTKIYRLDIFYVGEQSFGFRYPGAANAVDFTVRLLTSAAAVKENFVTTLEVYRDAPTSTCFRNFASNVGLKNVFMMRLKPSIAIPAGGFLDFQFPNTVVSQGAAQSSFSKTLGLTEYNAQAVECYGFTVTAGTKSAWGGVTRCEVDYGGDNSLDRTATVKVILSATMATTTEYQIDIYSINNPITTDVLSYVRMVAGTGTTRDYYQVYTDSFHLYTVTKAAITEPAQTLPTITPATIQLPTSFNLPITTATSGAVSLAQDINHIRLTYNWDMNNAGMAATGFETFDVIPGLAYYYNKAAKTTSFNLPLTGMLTPDSGETFVPTFKAQIIKQKVVSNEISYTVGGNAFAAIQYTSVTVPSPYNLVKSNDKSAAVVQLTLSKILSKTGSISLYTKNMVGLDPTCSESTSAIGNGFSCTAVSATELRISGLAANLPVGTVIGIQFRLTTSSLTTGQVCARAFNDNPTIPTAATETVQLETCFTMSYTSQPGIVWFEARTPTRIRRIQATERGMMTFPVTLPVSVPRMTSSFKVLDLVSAFANIETKDFECFFSNKLDLVAKSCIYYAATKVWEVKTPRTTDLTGDVTLTIVPARQWIEFARLDGIQMPAVGASYSCELEVVNLGGTQLHKSPELNANIPVRHFTSHYFNSYLIMKDAFSTFHLKIQPSVVVTAAPNGVIKIDFKVKNRYGLDVFNPDLGTSVLNGDVYDCPSATGGFVSKCRLFLGNAATPASILVDPQANMLTTAVYDIDFPALLNPLLNMTEVLVEVTTQVLTAGTWVSQNTEHVDVFVAQEVFVTPKPRPMLTWVPNTTGAPSAVTFTFTMDPTYGAVKSSTTSFDRIVIKVDKPILDILNDQALAGKVLVCPGYNIKIFDSKDMIELSTTTGIAAGSTVSISCTNFLNQQYVIRGGLKHYVELWIDGTVADSFEYAANTVTPHLAVTKNVIISAITPEISSFDTYTLTVKPFNYMPVGSRFEINFNQAFSGLTNCEIVSGLNGGICQILEDDSGFDRIKISKFQLWNPDTDPEIKITIDMTSPPTAGTYAFNFVSYWEENTVTPSLEDKIDEDVLGSITYIGFVPFPYLSLDKMYQGSHERCPHRYWEGVVKIKMQLVEDLVYPHTLRIGNWYWNTWTWEERETQIPFVISEFLCYFDVDNILFSTKSELCYIDGSGNLLVMIPEELSLSASNNYTLNVESRGQRDRGLSTNVAPEFRWPCYTDGIFNATGVVTTSSAPMFCKERACFFGTRDYTSTNWNQDYKYSLEIQDSTGIGYSNIGGERVNSRMQVMFSTHNEIKAVSRAELGWTLLTTLNATDSIPCIYWHDPTLMSLPALKQAYEMLCKVYNVQPSYTDYLSKYAVVNMFNHSNANYGNDNFRFGFAGITNYFVTNMKAPGYADHVDGNRNTFAHIIVQSQTEYEDGTWIDQNRVVQWYHINRINPAVVEATITTNSPQPSTNYLPFGILHATYEFYVVPEITLGGRTWVYTELEFPFSFLSRNNTHGSRWCYINTYGTDNYCMQYNIPFRWSLWLTGGVNAGTTYNFRHFGLMETPSIALTGPWTTVNQDKQFKVYFANNFNMVRIKIGPISIRTRTPYFIFETDDAHNEKNIWMNYRIGVWSVNTYENYTNMVRMWINADFPDIGPDCKVLFGFTRRDMNKLAPADGPLCNIIKNDPSVLSPSPGNFHRVEFYNMYRWSRRYFDQYEGWMVFELRLRNPASDMWPRYSNFQGFDNNLVWPLVNESRFNYLIWNDANQARVWVGNTTTKLAHYFRVVRNRKTFEQRRQKEGEWAELHMRLWPKNVYPANISKVDIQIPQSYDIPNGGNKICEVGHDYHQDLTGQFCEISNERRIQVNTNPNFGLLDRCTIVRITTEKSVKNNNGFQAPAVTATEDFEANLYIGTKRIEYTSEAGVPEPSKLVEGATLNISSNVIETLGETTLNLSFHAARAVRAGYDSDVKVTDVFKKLPQGVIYLKFNTYDTYVSTRVGFSLDLGYVAPYNPGGAVPFTVPCQPFKNLVPKSNENIICTVYPQATLDYYNPVVLKITNFELIPENKLNIEVHILKLQWITNVNNQGWVEFSIYEVQGDGTLEKTYDDVRISLGALTNLGTALVTRNSAHALNPVLTPALVGARIDMDIKFSTQVPLFQYDVIEVTFPSMMILPSAEDVSAVFYVVNGANTYYVSCDIVIYPLLNRVNFIIPRSYSIYGCTTTVICTVSIKTAGFRHVPYELAAPGYLTFTVRVINKKQAVQLVQYNQVAAPPRSKFNSLLVTMSSQFSRDIYVTYQFNFSPSYLYPSGSKVLITLETVKYRHIDKSNPPAACTTNFQNVTLSCVISEALITITLNGTLPEGFSAVVTGTGLKNPEFEGTTGTTDIKFTALHPIGLPINEDFANTLVYKPRKNVDTIIFKIDLSSYYSEVSSDYKFTLQNTNTLPPKGILNIEMPQKWSQNLKSTIEVVTISGGFTKSKLIYQQKAIKQPSEKILLQIIPDFEWPSKQKLIISLKTILNPSGITTTDAFKIYTQYDSVVVDRSDYSDPGSMITLKPYDPKIKIWKTDFTPQNEGEIAIYTVKISCQTTLLAGQKVQFMFPPNYSEILTVYPLTLKCSSTSYKIGTCTASSRSLIIPLAQQVNADDQIDFIIEGIANPNYGTDNPVDISILDETDTVIQFLNDAFTIDTIKGATYTPLGTVTASKNQILIKSDYQECMKISGDIPSGAAIILDFPKQFDMRKDAYSCFLGDNHDSTVLTYPSSVLACTVFPHLKRIEITGHTNVYTHSGAAKQICYKIQDLENSKDTGQSFHFNMRVFDVKSKKILYKTAGILNYPSTLLYERKGLRIFVDAVPSIPLGTMSNDIKITLENAVPYDITLIPSCPGMTFIPDRVLFKFYEGPVQTFRINPDKTLVTAGTYSISWVKEESTTGTTRFSEMVDTYFQVTSQPDFRALRLTVSQNVYRASVGAESMPIYVYLSHPASTAMTVFYKTTKPFQPEAVKFSPESVTFEPGEKVKVFTYTTFSGAVSGLIDIQLQPEFRDIYYMPTPQINFEIEDLDNKPPNIEEYSLTSLKMKSAGLRISCDESARIYYICSIKGTITPSVSELKSKAARALSMNRPRTEEIQGYEFSTITSQTRTYIYYDTQVDLTGLSSDTRYVIFMMPVDLSGNVGTIKTFEFKTAASPPPVTFKLRASSAISSNNLLQALSLVSGITTDKFVITYTPAFSTIPVDEQVVQDVLDSKNLEYEIMILPDVTIDGPTPYDYVKKIEDEKETLFTELPALDPAQMISETGKEVTTEKQKFTYKPKLVEVSNFHALFNVSLFYSGAIYGVILPANEAKPSAVQVKDGLTSVNRQVLDKYFGKVSLTVNTDKAYKVYPSGNLNFTFLYHSSNYVAYFIGERATYGDPILMDDNEVIAVPLKTEREIFKVDDNVVELNQSNLLGLSTKLVVLLLIMHTFIFN